MKIARSLVAATAACAAVLSLSGTANATTPVLYHGDDWARTYYVNDDIISVHDGENDGHYVGVGYYLNDGSYHVLADTNGPNNGGATADWTDYDYLWIMSYRICESDGGGCTDFRGTDGAGGF